ncbi:hypothetical protein EYF80_023614 [Liparis tanakae]|uniref:Uncharacterized protein n=1 Tax=Liparis tanakae TaxID=230148 RepID=A0A4Z2HK45_9TELE|nr:hypothetical protein EYF80_023614 [Liparis tanakae]
MDEGMERDSAARSGMAVGSSEIGGVLGKGWRHEERRELTETCGCGSDSDGKVKHFERQYVSDFTYVTPEDSSPLHKPRSGSAEVSEENTEHSEVWNNSRARPAPPQLSELTYIYIYHLFGRNLDVAIIDQSPGAPRWALSQNPSYAGHTCSSTETLPSNRSLTVHRPYLWRENSVVQLVVHYSLKDFLRTLLKLVVTM